MNKLTLSAFADEYSDIFTEQLRALNKFGINYLELRHADGRNVSEMSYDDVSEIIKKLDAHNIKVSSIGSPLGKISVDGNIEEHIEVAKRVFETAERLGAKYVRMFSFYIPDGMTPESCRSRVFDYVGRLIRAAEEYCVTLCHENEAKIYGESPERCLDLLDCFAGKLRAVFDMGNFVLDGYKPYPDAYKTLSEYIEYFHIKDALYKGAIVPAGKGEAQIKEILDDYRINGKGDAFITLEPHLETFAGLNALVGKSFDNPYKYENQKAAFTDAVEKIKEIIKE